MCSSAYHFIRYLEYGMHSVSTFIPPSYTEIASVRMREGSTPRRKEWGLQRWWITIRDPASPQTTSCVAPWTTLYLSRLQSVNCKMGTNGAHLAKLLRWSRQWRRYPEHEQVFKGSFHYCCLMELLKKELVCNFKLFATVLKKTVLGFVIICI